MSVAQTNLLGLLAPEVLYGLPGILFLWVFIVWRLKAKNQLCKELDIAPKSHTNSLWLAAAPFPFVMTVLLLALSRPYFGFHETSISVRGLDYMFVVDVSQSMLAEDLSPSRIEVAKRKMRDLILALGKNGDTNRFGITLFAGSAYPFCPLTSDTSVLTQFISMISPSMVSSLGSNLEAGIDTALERFKVSRSQNSRIVILSDGEDDSLVIDRIRKKLDPSSLAENGLNARRIQADAIGVGKLAGGTIPLNDDRVRGRGSLLHDQYGQIVTSKLQEGGLQSIAANSGGAYARVTPGDDDINVIVRASKESLGNLAQLQTTNRISRTYNELGPLLCGIVAVILCWWGIAKRGVADLLRLTLLPLLITYTSAVAQSEKPPESSAVQIEDPARAAYDAYISGDFEKAMELYRAAISEDPSNQKLNQGLASSLFKLGEYTQSAKLFEQLSESAKTGKEHYDALYNLGNALLADGSSTRKLDQAIKSFEQALRVKPEDGNALHNLGIAKQRRASLRPTPTPTPTFTPTATPANSPSASPSPSPSPQNQSPTAEPSASALPSPSSQPSQSPSAQPSQSGEPSPSPSETKSADSTSQPNLTQTPERLKEAEESETTPEPQPSQTESSDQSDSEDNKERLNQEALSQNEAKAWLESLPESPLLIRRQNGEHGSVRGSDQKW